ncbi:hypothetical protein [Amycolatopsis panacis]|uniref:Uncharacterized protein n=1 Tax=Amycolatopsis panacis TaxID=2340917 RepID=A0A419I4H0_9PSEU|nr:hypothetical protein [Amycolatopsis panacis]RJQ85257.1 hypothetical protein D5S19_14420 [Amycolatopsis panacis]
MNDIGKYLAENPATVFVVGGEIAFWLLIVGGLVARYGLKKRRLSTVLLAGVPVLDLVVLIATVLDLTGGAVPNLSHGLAAVYLGFSVVFGPSMVRWADVRFAHRFAGGPPPLKPRGRAKLRHEWREWAKCLLASAIAAGLLLVAIALIHRPGEDRALWDWLPRLGTVTAVWLFVGPLWQELFGNRPRNGADRPVAR